MNYNILWSGALATALVLIVTFWKAHLERRKRIRGHREALRTEILMYGGYARVFRQDGVASPVYRLPTSCFAVSFAALLADGALMDSGAKALLRFYNEVEAFNRGLDLAEATYLTLRTAGSPVVKRTTTEVYDRNLMKAKTLAEAGKGPDRSTDEPAGEHYNSAVKALNIRLDLTLGSLSGI